MERRSAFPDAPVGARILIVSGIFPPDIGGPATYVPQIAAGLLGRGHAVAVLTLADRLDPPGPAYPFPVIRIRRGGSRLPRLLAVVLTLLRVGRRADVLYVNGLALEAVLANLLLRRPLVLKVVGDLAWERATLWGWVTDGFEPFQQRRYGMRVEALRRLRAWWSRRADVVIVPSRYLARWVRGWGVSGDRLCVIYNAVDLPGEIAPAAQPLRTPRTVVASARLVPWKQIDRVIEAIAPLDGVGLVVLGDGPERAALEHRVGELSIGDRVHFAGTRAPADALALMAACDAFVLYSLYEGLPHVVLEAMALDLPVVATPIGGIPEIVEHGRSGLLVDPTDTAALQDALRRVLFSEEERRRLRAGAARTLEQFRPETMLAETERVLTGLVVGPAPAAARRDA